ncbi:MAG: hypothetical protein EHM39_08135 [Chloroflexi bacterium]|nr:MAG: hypothetical protein EHM39_08135 [Chloroflexota bacterium]
MTPTEHLHTLSLLWPPDVELHTQPTLTAATVSDLDVHRIVNALAEDYGYAVRIRDTLLNLCDDPAVITYRQNVLADLMENSALAERLAAVLPKISALDSWGFAEGPGQSPLHEVVWRVGQLETYVEVVQGLSDAFDGLDQPARSEGLVRLHDLAAQTAKDETFQRLVVELPDLLARVRSVASVTIGVNLDDRLRPVEATLLAVNKRKFHGPSASLLGMLFGRETADSEWEGIAPLHAARSNGSPSTAPFGLELDNPMLYPLFRDLADILKKISRPVASALHHYTRINARFLDGLGAELAFYLGAIQLARRLRARGFPVCRPEIAPPEERVSEIEGLVNLHLALRLLARSRHDNLNGAIVPNDITFNAEGRIFVLTGPNQGGKTTYTQAVGLIHLLAQAGLFVPAQRARISPVDDIYTHFPVEERPEMEAGRLGEEAQRLGAIFAAATRRSLVLLNESLASTSFSESLYLARDIVRTLRVLGARAIYATHLHELAAGCDDLNAGTPGDSRIVSLVSLAQEGDGTGEITQTYRVIPGPPRGRSYARELAARYGISYEQLTALLRSRGMG